jgi:hypothetical protein
VSTDGVHREIITWEDPLTGATHTDTILTYPPNPNGRTDQERAGYSRTTSQVRDTYLAGANTLVTSTTNSGNDGMPTGATKETTTYGTGEQPTDYTRTSYAPDGKETSSQSTHIGPDGSQTLTRTHGDGAGKEVDQVVEIGANTPGIVGLGDQPADDALKQLRPGDA